jgi:lipid A disaccharide synthetase
VKELLQNDMNANNITKQIIYLLSGEGQEKTKTEYRELINSLTSKTNPYKEAAKYILQ